MSMKQLNRMAAVAAVAWLLNSVPALAQVNFTTSDGTNYTAKLSSINIAIPDNTPVGLGYALNFGATGLNLGAVSVTLNISGGYNGDIYAYLSHGDTLVQLLNPNPAMSSSGFTDITLVAIGTAGAVALPTDGTALTAGGSYFAHGSLGNFNNTNPNGMWTLYFADLSAGDVSTLNNFTVSIMIVPEPGTLALAMLGGFMVFAAVRRRLA